MPKANIVVFVKTIFLGLILIFTNTPFTFFAFLDRANAEKSPYRNMSFFDLLDIL